jgi:hypothetical protein
MAKSNRKEKKINFYQHKIYMNEAELMQVRERYNLIPKGSLDLDKGKTNHIHRLRTKMLQIEKTIRNYQQMIEEVKAM